MERLQEQIASSLRHIKEAVQQNMNEQSMHSSGGQVPAEYEQDDMGQWSEDGKMGYGGPDAKKRRGVSDASHSKLRLLT